jgi:hypothetical protein
VDVRTYPKTPFGLHGGPDAARFPEDLDPATGADLKAWELIDAEVGRYMPRRIRGSFRGRALG